MDLTGIQQIGHVIGGEMTSHGRVRDVPDPGRPRTTSSPSLSAPPMTSTAPSDRPILLFRLAARVPC